MRLLLDTHVLLWWWAADPRLPGPILEAVASPETEVFVSAASAWEMSIKAGLGRLDAPTDDFSPLAEASGFEVLPITVADAVAVRHLPLHHRDPFDRMLIVQAQRLGASLASLDGTIPRYDVAVLPAHS